ncbi:hypothetical protein HDV00_003164 [Rhizophlyctis rosea]|nr:hypothetical protein HDV00_003164 [Rhizophlyctis rosea]
MSTDITTLARTNVETLRKAYIAFLNNNPSNSRSDAAIAAVADHFTPNTSYIYFFGELCDSRASLIASQYNMREQCPTEGNSRVEEEHFEVLWSSEDACLVRVKEHWWMGETKLVTLGTYFYERDGSAPEGVRVVHYQETNVQKETTMKF